MVSLPEVRFRFTKFLKWRGETATARALILELFLASPDAARPQSGGVISSVGRVAALMFHAPTMTDRRRHASNAFGFGPRGVVTQRCPALDPG